MAASKIPEEIKKHRPGPCTEVKLINGHYYVYMYQSVQLPSGKWGKKTGKSIGTIIADKGFIPNSNYHLLMPVSSTPMGLSIKIRFIVTTSRAGFRRNTKPFPSKWEKLLLGLFWITLEEEPQG